jgi:hypothetical protein
MLAEVGGKPHSLSDGLQTGEIQGHLGVADEQIEWHPTVHDPASTPDRLVHRERSRVNPAHEGINKLEKILLRENRSRRTAHVLIVKGCNNRAIDRSELRVTLD